MQFLDVNALMTFLFHRNKLLLYLIKIYYNISYTYKYNNITCNWLYLIRIFYILKFGRFFVHHLGFFF